MELAATNSNERQRRLLVLGLLMVLASLSAWVLTPNKSWSVHSAEIKYVALMPERFGDWVLADEQSTSVVNPQQQQTLDAIYDQVVNKVYVHKPSGRRIMLSLAYGSNQSRATQIHKPEVCYPAQGFEILSMRKDQLMLPYAAAVPVMRIVTRMGRRIEPLTYWIRSGDRVVRGSIEQNLARIALGFKGYVPDGLLFRVSEINDDVAGSFALQDKFVREFLAQLPADSLESFIGTGQK